MCKGKVRDEMKIHTEHIQVLKTLYDTGAISRHAMKSIRGQIITMQTHEEREEYLEKIIKRTAKRGDRIGKEQMAGD